MLPQLARIKGAALDLFFPARCVGCGREGKFLCADCLSAVKHIYPPLCPLCGRPQASGVLCPDCVSWQADIDGIRSPFRFEGVIREAIHQFKYKNLRSIANLLANYLGDYLAAYPLPADVILPVPLHPKRLRERGYNQSELLARGLGRLTGLPVSENCLERTRFVLPQAKTRSVSERRANVTGIFKCNDSQLKGRNVIIIDDVATSGATLNAYAQVVRSSGAISVWGLTLAREI